MTNLTATEQKVAKVAVESAPQVPQRARLVKDGDSSYVAVEEAFDRAWRRVGLALDRSGFTVEDRDRSKGVYFVRYIDQAADAESKAGSSFIRRWLGTWKDEKKDTQRYQIRVSAAGESSRVVVLDDKGAQSAGSGAARILGLLNDQLK